ncbi:MAG: acyl carrier protein [Actinomycetota bacterium]
MERAEVLAALSEVAVGLHAQDLDADSLDLVEFVMGLEERFDISVPEEELENVATVGQAVDLVLAKVAAKS